MKFDINIAVLGCQSTGKSTVVNALCGAEVTEVNFQRTTEGINIYSLSQPTPSAEVPGGVIDIDDSGEEGKKRRSSPEEDVAYTKRFRLAEETFIKVKQRNVELKNALPGEQTKYYEVPLLVAKVPISMRENTQLRIIESPGLNNADHVESRQYFEKNWDTLDGCILVVDAKLSADHEDQKQTMTFVRDLCINVKEIPCFIVCNKVDDPDSLPGTEDEVKLETTRQAVEKIWEVSCRKRALKDLVDSSECSMHQGVFPVFVPISAKAAFLLRAGSAMTETDFLEKMRGEHFQDIGQREFGKQWRSMNIEDKAKKMYEYVQNPSSQGDLLRMSGFANLLSSLERGVGGDRRQLGLIQKKLNSELSNSSLEIGNLKLQLRRIDDKLTLLKESKNELMKKFWDSYKSCEEAAFVAFQSQCDPGALALAAQMLVEYQEFCASPDSGGEWKGEIPKVQAELASYVQRKIATINEHANNWSFVKWKESYQKLQDSGAASVAKASSHGTSTAAGISWESLSPVDWQRILTSMMLLGCKEVFCCHFGREMELLERHKLIFHKYCLWCPSCDSCECTEEFHKNILVQTRVDLKRPDMVPLDEESHASLVKIKIPRDFKDSPEHFAHIGWLFCKAME